MFSRVTVGGNYVFKGCFNWCQMPFITTVPLGTCWASAGGFLPEFGQGRLEFGRGRTVSSGCLLRTFSAGSHLAGPAPHSSCRGRSPHSSSHPSRPRKDGSPCPRWRLAAALCLLVSLHLSHTLVNNPFIRLRLLYLHVQCVCTRGKRSMVSRTFCKAATHTSSSSSAHQGGRAKM